MDPRRDYEPIRYHNTAEQDKLAATARLIMTRTTAPATTARLSGLTAELVMTYDFVYPTDAEGRRSSPHAGTITTAMRMLVNGVRKRRAG